MRNSFAAGIVSDVKNEGEGLILLAKTRCEQLVNNKKYVVLVRVVSFS